MQSLVRFATATNRQIRTDALLLCLASLAWIAGPARTAATTLHDGDIVVLEQGNGAIPAALIRIDPTTGAQEAITSGGLGGTGVPNGFVFDAVSGYFFVVGRDGGLRSVDPATGAETMLAVLSVGGSATGIAIAPNGDFLVTDYGGRLLRVERHTHQVSTLASLSMTPYAVQVDIDGQALVSGFGSSIVRVDPETGAQTLLLSTAAGNIYDFAVTGHEIYFALSSPGWPSGHDQVVRLDLDTKVETVVYDGLQRVLDVDIDEQGRLIVLDQCLTSAVCAGSPVVYRANASGGLDVVARDGLMFVPGRLDLFRRLDSSERCEAELTQCLAQERDADGDGELDPGDRCPDTPRGENVDDSGCSRGQFCARRAISRPADGIACRHLDWGNDEPLSPLPFDCSPKRAGPRWICTASSGSD